LHLLDKPTVRAGLDVLKYMTTKDYVYLGLILLTALAFYCNGFYAGVYRCKRMYEELIGDTESENEAQNSSPKSDNFFAHGGKEVAMLDASASYKERFQRRELRGDFSNN